MTFQTILYIVCAWCGCDMGTKDGKGTTGTSHSICEKCWKEKFPNHPYPKEKTK